MSVQPVLAPDLGLPAGEKLRLSAWLVSLRDDVIEGDRLAELLAPGFTFDVASPTTGMLCRICVEPDDLVRPGMVLAEIRRADEHH